jgi:tRNA A37 threonylcarbamoyladenosine synthetase subunit TsaC/SUA5/YrdC
MTAREKAQDLINEYSILAESINWSNEDTQKKAEKYNDDLGEDVLYYWHELAKRSALIAVDEILGLMFLSQAEINYWKEVKQEINQL